MSKLTQIHFVTWPDGKICEGTQTSISPDHAIGAALRTWLIPAFFPNLNLGGRYHGPMRELWKSMEEGGFKVHTLDLPKETADGVSY